MRIKRGRQALAALSALALLAGCGSTATSGSGGGSEIKIGSMASLTSSVYQVPEYKAGFQAAADSVNAAGGVNGRKLNVVSFCDTTYTQNGELGCARSIVGSKADVVVGPYTQIDQTGSVWKVFQAAKIPVIGGDGGSVAELNDPNSFPLSSGFAGGFIGTAQGVVDAGAKTIAIVIDTNPVGQFAADMITNSLKDKGVTNVRTVKVDPNVDPTFATSVARATSGGVDGVIIAAAPVNVARFVDASKGAGYQGKIVVTSQIFPTQVIQQLGPKADGVIVDNNLAFTNDTNNPGVQKFKADMAKYAPQAPLNTDSETGWATVQLFAKAAAGAKSYDSAGLLAAFQAVETPIDIGVTGSWAVVGRAGTVPNLPRVLNPGIAFGVVKNGEVVPDGRGFINVFSKAP
ncbi:ABC transporter substrate-binding protein [Amycolatopsis pithecellobii]|uniref:ABC transporter substrate-binding protein n=1 Tax=Amycolatopsis pithecellobii TaxID=664692 RepID=A0A6N7Z389_9PSEU|nr:ABC transporter substrate-binding protein [Amycolatopsis pithecellobii]MTD54454.1 ABC transporter substrate-binding protein [Amycolatopsis pithecellobii]